jgi:urea carboxylase-associated protein 1
MQQAILGTRIETTGAGPSAPDRVVFETTLAPRGHIAREIARGEVLRVVDLEGRQVGDLVAFNKADLGEKFWISNTVRLNGTVFVTTGHVLYSELSRPMFTIVADTCGRHDLLAGSCNAEIDKVRYGVDAHYGCVENFLAALAPYGIQRRDIPMSLNLFMNCPVEASGAWTIATAVSKPGDYIDLRAEMDCVFALSNCPQDLNPCNDGKLKPLHLVIYRP